ncbi:MAG: TetR/AcrR family transcriptional regulator [Oscillospiraceae bacterium]
MSNFTRKEIVASFLRLLEKKPFAKITIKDIADDCGINRNTFYYHYQDIYGLAEAIFIKDVEKEIAHTQWYENWQEFYLKSIRFFKEHVNITYNIYNSVKRDKLENYVFRITNTFMRDFVNRDAEGLSVSEEDRRFIADFYTYAFEGVALNWVENGMKQEPEELIQKMGPLIDGSICDAFEALKNKSAALKDSATAKTSQ